MNASPAADAAATRGRIDLRIELNYQVDPPGAQFVFNVHAAHTPSQTLRSEGLSLSQPHAPQMYTDPLGGNRCMRLHAAAGALRLTYVVSLDLLHHCDAPARVDEVPLAQLPPEVMDFTGVSHHCPSGQWVAIANAEFGALTKGYRRVQTIRDWVRDHAASSATASNPGAPMLGSLVEPVDVFCDPAHLMIALCRALQVPARFVTGIACGAGSAPGPLRFQACVEAYLGHRWYIFDPCGTAAPSGFVRFGTGRDAADVALAAVVGSVKADAPMVSARAVDAPSPDRPMHRPGLDALSIAGGPMYVPNDAAAGRCASDRLSRFALQSAAAHPA